MLDTRMEPAVAQGMLRGAPDALVSAFHLSYAMLLNLLRGGGAAPEELLRASFRQFQTARALPALRARAAALEARLPRAHAWGYWVGLLHEGWGCRTHREAWRTGETKCGTSASLLRAYPELV